jgi:Methyltransferase domain
VKKLLNIGGNNKRIPLPPQYAGWEHVLLDIDPKGKPDVVCDARELFGLPAAAYDAVYCSHNLEHYYRHDVPKVLEGFQHVLKDDGFAHIRVPDIAQVMRAAVQGNLDINDTLYQSASGPISVQDVIYGFGEEIERSGDDFYAHKCGFTPESLALALSESGFAHVFTKLDTYEVAAFAFVTEPDDAVLKLFRLSAT